MRAAGNDVVDEILMRNLEPIIDDRHLDSGSAHAERVQDVHIQIDAWPRTLVAKHRLALIEQMPLVAEQRVAGIACVLRRPDRCIDTGCRSIGGQREGSERQ